MATKKRTQEIQEELKESAHKIWLAGLGALAVAEEEGSKLFKNLVEKGESYESRGREQYAEVKSKVEKAADKAKGRASSTWDRLEDRVDDAVARALGRLGVPTREEIATLTRRVEELTAVVERLKPAPQAAGKPVVQAS